MSRECSSCGFENESDAVFCRNCGTSLTPQPTVAQPDKAPTKLLHTEAVRPPSETGSKLGSTASLFRRLRTGSQSILLTKDGLKQDVEYKKLASKFEKLLNSNKTLEEELQTAREKINQIEEKMTKNSEEADEALRGVHARMARLLEET